MDYFWLAFLWIAYFILHSVLALFSVKNFFYSLGIKPQLYRLFYVILATSALLVIIIYSSLIVSEYVFSPNKLMKFSGLILAGWGFVIAKAGFKSYDTKAFLGLGSLNPEDEFKTDGLLSKMRHPVYSGSILLVLGYFLFDPKWSTLLSVSLIIVYFIVGIYLEEKKLIKSFGSKYIEYKKETPMLIPRFWKKS